MNIYVWNQGPWANQVVSKDELRKLKKSNPVFKVWSIESACEIFSHPGPNVTMRDREQALNVLRHAAEGGSRRARQWLKVAEEIFAAPLPAKPPGLPEND